VIGVPSCCGRRAVDLPGDSLCAAREGRGCDARHGCTHAVRICGRAESSAAERSFPLRPRSTMPRTAPRTNKVRALRADQGPPLGMTTPVEKGGGLVPPGIRESCTSISTTARCTISDLAPIRANPASVSSQPSSRPLAVDAGCPVPRTDPRIFLRHCG
jgi:hypothetical protein